MTKDQSAAIAMWQTAQVKRGFNDDVRADLWKAGDALLAALADSRPVGEPEPEEVKRAREVISRNEVYANREWVPESLLMWSREIIAAYEALLAARPPVEGGGE